MRWGVMWCLLCLIGGCALKQNHSQGRYSFSYLEERIPKKCLPPKTVGVWLPTGDVGRSLSYTHGGIARKKRAIEWAKQPLAMFHEILIRALNDSCIDAISLSSISNEMPHTLKSEILTLALREDKSGGIFAVAEVKFVFTGEGNYSWVFSKSAKVEGDREEQAIVHAVNKALNGVIADFKKVLEEI